MEGGVGFMTLGPLSARVAELCQQTAPGLGPASRDAVGAIAHRLDQPLRVAVAGRLKAGKSTLVNALIGKRVAPTDVGECTHLVTQFRYGTVDRVDVVNRDGTRITRPLDPSGMLPARLGVPLPQVAYLDVTLTIDRLRELTVIDTPGLGSTNDRVSAGAVEFLLDEGSLAAVSGAEAAIYVFTQAVRADDIATLAAFRALSERLSSNPINSLGLFNKIDKLATGSDPWPVAIPLAREQAELLRHQVNDVVPVVGLLAETIEAGRITGGDCESLRVLSKLPSDQRSLLLASADLFMTQPAPVDEPTRRRLLELLDLYGIAFALYMLVQDPALDIPELIHRLSQASGFARARNTLDRVFRRRADIIKAGWALSALENAAGTSTNSADRELLRDAIERLVQQPQYHQLRLIDAATQVTTGAVELPRELEAEMIRLALGDTPVQIFRMHDASTADLVAAATAAAARWRSFAVAGATPAQARVAHVVHRGFFLLSQRLGAASQDRL
ncbi:MAG TPA: dynamin family protein [Mycobacteriales bacterium]|nr:dynamin family protein [Mycobacteriales bacterium]